jgi:DNA-directed RNA polymerase I, II, and III subunit RPABC2
MSEDEYYSGESDSDDTDKEDFTPSKKIPSKSVPKYNEEDDEDEDEDDDIEDPLDDVENELEDEIDEDDDDSDEDEEQPTNKNGGNIGVQSSLNQYGSGNEEEEDDDEDYDDTYLQKFDIDVNKNYINEFHPECMIHNYDEISKLTVVVRNESNIIVDPLHRTIPFLTKYEKAKVLGQRSKQIECGSKPLVKVPENIVDGYIIAELELQQKRIPFIIKRPIPGGAFEYWNIRDLEIITF